MSTRRLLVIGILLVVVAAAGIVAMRATRDSAPPASAGSATAEAPAPTPQNTDRFSVRLFKNPTAVPELTIRTLDGKTIRSADLRGKVTLINFWATWCGPCRAEIPDLVRLQEKYRDHLVVIGVSEDEGSIENVKRFAAKYGVNYPIAMSTPELQRAFPGVAALPTTFVLDRDVRVAQKHIGMLDPRNTEHETLALAGLALNASVERVEPDKPVGLANAAQAKEIPGIDLTRLTPEKRMATLERLNSEGCTCGCDLTIARCRIEDPSCSVSLPIARKIAAEIARAKP